MAHAQDLFDAAPDAYVTTDAAGVVTEVNDMAQRLIGPVADRLVPLEQFVESHGRHTFRVTLDHAIPRGGRQDWHLRLEPRPDQVGPTRDLL